MTQTAAVDGRKRHDQNQCGSWRDAMRAGLQGAVAGAVATGPMTAAMGEVDRMLPPEERLPMPQEPLLITEALLRRCGLEEMLTRSQRRRLSWCAHFSYGAACGAMFAWLRGRHAPGGLTHGPGYGLAVFALSYCGWLPATGVLPGPPHRRAGRNAVLIASHLAWGSVLALVLQQQHAPATNASRR